MAADKVVEVLVEAIKQALTDPVEHRLYRSGKLDGLFASRAGVNAEAAARAVRDGLLEVTRTETRGKTTTEWVRLTPQGVNFLHEHESPRQALEDLRTVLQANREHVPLWLADQQRQLQELGRRLAEEAARWTQRLDSLSRRVEEALERAEAAEVGRNGAAANLPWAKSALAYLERRRAAGAVGECPLPELFAAVRQEDPELSVVAFHDGLRRLEDRHALRLLPFTGPPAEMTEPEFALLDGPSLLYFAAR